MEQRRLGKQRIVDWIVEKATWRHFKGDERDGEARAITIENFGVESARYGAKALRTRLSRLSLTELLTEARTVRDYLKAGPSELAQIAERVKRDEAARALRQRQAELGRRSRLQPAILAAARHYRERGMTAKKAWDALNKTPFTTDEGNAVKIEGGEQMRVMLRDGTQKRPIKFGQWRQRYWSAATKPG
jgi:hypothetical protein